MSMSEQSCIDSGRCLYGPPQSQWTLLYFTLCRQDCRAPTPLVQASAAALTFGLNQLKSGHGSHNGLYLTLCRQDCRAPTPLVQASAAALTFGINQLKFYAQPGV